MCKPLIPEMPSIKRDYLDEMIEAHRVETSRWYEKIDFLYDIHEIRRDSDLIKKKLGSVSFEDAHQEFVTMMMRAGMEAAYKAARECFFRLVYKPVPHDEAVIAHETRYGLQNLVSDEEWNSIFGLPEIKTEELPSHSHHIGNYVWNGPALGITNLGDGVALMSVAHPVPEESERDRIARVTREMCGG